MNILTVKYLNYAHLLEGHNKNDYRDAAQETVSELKEIGERILKEKIKERLTKKHKPGNTP